MNIPKSFKIFGQTIRVVWLKGLYKREKAWAIWYPNRNVITMQLPVAGLNLSKEQLEQTFIHEATHACLDILQYEKLSSDEDFVDRFSNALHQMIVTGILNEDYDKAR